MTRCMPWMLAVALCAAPAGVASPFETDVISTSAGDLAITFIGHGSLYFTFDGKVIHVDPFGQLTDYGKLPRADLVLVTHEHFDHLDPAALEKVRGPQTVVVANPAAAAEVKDSRVMKNGDTRTVEGIAIEAVPAYNLVHKRDNGKPFHPRGVGNGYILTFGDTDTGELQKLLGDQPDIEVRIRKMP